MNDSPEPRRMTSLDRKIEAAGRRAREEAAQHARGEPVMGDITGIGQGDVPMIRRDMTPRNASMLGDSDMAKRFAEHNLGRGFRLEDRAAGNPCKAGDIISVPPGAFVTGRRVERFTVPMSSAKMGEPMVYRGGCTVRLAVLEGGEVEVMVEYPATE